MVKYLKSVASFLTKFRNLSAALVHPAAIRAASAGLRRSRCELPNRKLGTATRLESNQSRIRASGMPHLNHLFSAFVAFFLSNNCSCRASMAVGHLESHYSSFLHPRGQYNYVFWSRVTSFSKKLCNCTWKSTGSRARMGASHLLACGHRLR